MKFLRLFEFLTNELLYKFCCFGEEDAEDMHQAWNHAQLNLFGAPPELAFVFRKQLKLARP
jgi:hypothetical protein